MGKKDGKLDLTRQKKGWLLGRIPQYGSLAKILLWGKREKPIGYIQFGPIAEFQTAELLYRDELPIPRGGWCVTCLFLQSPYQKRGLGKRLARHVLRDLKKRGVRTVDVYELPAFWTNFGFKPAFKDKKKKITIMRRKWW